MAGDYELEEHWEDFYSLPNLGCTAVEGSGDEWLAIADAIERGDQRLSFKRCAFHRDGDFIEFSSPRNSYGRGDCGLVHRRDAVELVRAIRQSVMRCRPVELIDGGGI